MCQLMNGLTANSRRVMMGTVASAPSPGSTGAGRARQKRHKSDAGNWHDAIKDTTPCTTLERETAFFPYICIQITLSLFFTLWAGARNTAREECRMRSSSTDELHVLSFVAHSPANKHYFAEITSCVGVLAMYG